MLDRLVASLLPGRALSPRAKWITFAFLLLFPAAYALAVLVAHPLSESSRLHITMERGDAIRIARQYADSLGVSTSGWSPACRIHPDPRLFSYLSRHSGPGLDYVERVKPPFTISVRFNAPNAVDWIDVELGPQGQPVGYDMRLSKAPAKNLAPEESAKLAERLTAANAIMRGPLHFGKPEFVTVERREDGDIRKFIWRSGSVPALETEYSVTLQGDRKLGESVDVHLDPSVAATEDYTEVILLVYAVFMCAVMVYSIYRYVRRALQGEVSHRRTLLMAGLFAIFFFIQIVASRDLIFGSLPNGAVSVLALLSVFSVLIAAGSLLAGIGYGSGEGDMREAYPGKLTSLDAMVVGKLWSRNVAGSLLFGVAFGGWVFLAQRLLFRLVSVPVHSLDLNVAAVLFVYVPWLLLFVTPLIFSVLMVASGIMQPVAFLHQNIRSPQWRWILLAVSAAIAVAIRALSLSNLGLALISMFVMGAALFGSFMLRDLVASITMLTCVGLASFLIEISRISPHWVQNGYYVSELMTGLSLLMVFVAVRGREYSEEQVRPLYARHVAERLSMQAEVAAAREAQLRLLPQAVPEIPGLSMAASCVPAHAVGGDFYDFFLLGGQRVGIFIVDGGSRALAGALSIPLAKGFLMHAVRVGLSPTQILVRLESTLGSLFTGSSGTTNLAYAVLDAESGEVQYARTGDSPRILAAGPDGHGTLPQRELAVSIQGRSTPIIEGSWKLQAGSTIFLFTDGLAPDPESLRRWMQPFAGEPGVSAQQMHAELMSRAIVAHKREYGELRDDLTAVTIRVHQLNAARLEGVA
jgi:Stage II sporulation protein E (SpoIIE)